MNPEAETYTCAQCGNFYQSISLDEFLRNEKLELDQAGETDFLNEVNSGSDLERDKTFEDFEDQCPNCQNKDQDQHFDKANEFFKTLSEADSESEFLGVFADHFLHWRKIKIHFAVGLLFIFMTWASFIFGATVIAFPNAILEIILPTTIFNKLILITVPAMLLLGTFLVIETLQETLRQTIKKLFGTYPFGADRSNVKRDTLKRQLCLMTVFALVMIAVFSTHKIYTLYPKQLALQLCSHFVLILITSAVQVLVLGILLPEFATHRNFNFQGLLNKAQRLFRVKWLLPFVVISQITFVLATVFFIVPGLVVLGLIINFHLCHYLYVFKNEIMANSVLPKVIYLRKRYRDAIQLLNGLKSNHTDLKIANTSLDNFDR